MTLAFAATASLHRAVLTGPRRVTGHPGSPGPGRRPAPTTWFRSTSNTIR